MKSECLIADPAQRKMRAAQKEAVVLSFLRDEIYSSTAILAVEMGIGERGARNVLNRMADKQLLVKDEVKFMGIKALPLWGITLTGVMHDLEPEDIERIHLRYHTPRRVSPRTIEHTLDVQRCRQYHLYSIQGISWVPTRLLPAQDQRRDSKLRWQVYPDGVVQYPSKDGNFIPVALEVERTRKTPARYVQIIKGHLKNIENDHYYRVIYYCQTQKAANSLRALFLRLMIDKGIKQFTTDYDDFYGPEECIQLFSFSSIEKFDQDSQGRNQSRSEAQS